MEDTDSPLVFCRRLRYQSLMARDSIDTLAQKLADAVPSGLQAMREDLEKNFRSVLSAGLSKMDLVSREEFDVQAAVLQRTRQKLEGLEQRLRLLENSEGGEKPAARKKAASKKSSAKKSVSRKKKPKKPAN